MATVFWDSQGVIYIVYLENGKTVTGLYYADWADSPPNCRKYGPFGEEKSALPS